MPAPRDYPRRDPIWDHPPRTARELRVAAAATKPSCPSLQDGCASPDVCRADGQCHYTGSPFGVPPVQSARDYSESNCCGRAPGSCPDCPLIVPPVPPVPKLTTDSNARKGIPMARGLLDYFPDALAEVARLSEASNAKHCPGEPLQWARERSSDHADCVIRHMIDRGKLDEDGFLHDAKVAWRALAMLQLALGK